MLAISTFSDGKSVEVLKDRLYLITGAQPIVSRDQC